MRFGSLFVSITIDALPKKKKEKEKRRRKTQSIILGLITLQKDCISFLFFQ